MAIRLSENEKRLEAEVFELTAKIKELESAKKYGLVWEDKPEKFEKESEGSLPILIEKGKDFPDIVSNKDDNFNILIEGDNYHSLSILSYTHRAKIDVIYIDPPYNTGNKDFVYNDSYIDRENSFRHSKWLSFMNKRLRLAKTLLSKDGVIFISIGEDEIAQLKMLCNEIFGEKNYITNFIWEKTQHFGRQKINSYSNADYILCYAKELNRQNLKELLVERVKEEHEDAPLYNASNPVNTLTFPSKKVIFNIDDGEYTQTADEKYQLVDKVIVKNKNNKNNLVLRFRSRWSQKRINEEIEKGTTFWIKSDNFAIRAIYGNGKTSNDSPKQIIFTNNNNEFCTRSRFGAKVGVTEEGSMELNGIVGDQNIFDYPKPKTLIEYLVSLFYNSKHKNYNKKITVLDFFAGSGTTGHSILNMNKQDNGDRRFILCTNNENNLCEKVTYRRLSKVIKGYKNYHNSEIIEGLGGNLKYLKVGFVKLERSIDTLKHKIIEGSTGIICAKENTFDLLRDIYKDRKIKIFQSRNGYTAILFDLFYFEYFIDELRKLTDKPVSIYVFSYTKEFSKEEFGDLNIKYTIEPIPENILEIYKKIYNF